MKLLFGIKAMNNPGGGAERVLATVVNGLSDRGYEVAVLTFEQPGGHSFYPLSDKVKRLDLGIGSTIHPATTSETLKRLPALRQAVLEYAPDVAIGFMHSMFIPLGFALVGTAIPLIASEHIVPEHYRSRRVVETVLLSITPLISSLHYLCVRTSSLLLSLAFTTSYDCDSQPGDPQFTFYVAIIRLPDRQNTVSGGTVRAPKGSRHID